MNRRKFIKSGVLGLAGLSILPYGMASDTVVGKTLLGSSGLTVSRIAMGTGTHGYNH